MTKSTTKKSLFPRIIVALLSLIMCLFIVACDSKDDSDADTSHKHNFTGLDISGVAQTEYVAGDSFNTEGLTVKALCDGCEGITLTDSQYTLLYQNGPTVKTFVLGDTKISVTYGTLTYDISVTVRKKTAADKTGDITGISFTSSFSDKPAENYLLAKTESTQISALLASTKNNDKQVTVLNWGSIKTAKSYSVELSLNEDMSDSSTFTVNTNRLIAGTLIPNATYYIKITALDSSKNEICSSLKTMLKASCKTTVRPINVDGMSNVRDLGGWTAAGGKTVVYGLVYRGGKTTDITADGKETFASTLGIKTEIDLRSDGAKNADIPGVNYKKYPISQCSYIIPGVSIKYDDANQYRTYSSTYGTSIKSIFDTFANPDNYPVYFHCNAGADRTGTIAYLLNGLLGVSYDDLVRDFELTSFSPYGARYRSKLINNNTAFDDSGIMQNNTNNFIALGDLNNRIMQNYGNGGTTTLSAAIENYLKTACNVSAQNIQKVKDIMLGNIEVDIHTPPANK